MRCFSGRRLCSQRRIYVLVLKYRHRVLLCLPCVDTVTILCVVYAVELLFAQRMSSPTAMGRRTMVVLGVLDGGMPRSVFLCCFVYGSFAKLL